METRFIQKTQKYEEDYLRRAPVCEASGTISPDKNWEDSETLVFPDLRMVGVSSVPDPVPILEHVAMTHHVRIMTTSGTEFGNPCLLHLSLTFSHPG